MYPLGVCLVIAQFLYLVRNMNMESTMVTKCPYVVHTRERERGDWGKNIGM